MKPPKKLSQKSRKVFYLIHLWTGLLLGLWLVLMGLTGSLLSWRAEITEWEVRQRVSAPTPDPGAQKIPVSRAIAALKAFNPELKPERGITLPVSRTGYYLHSARGEVNGKRIAHVYLVHPDTAKVYPPVVKSTLWIDINEQIHHNLLAGVKGTIANGFFTFFALFMLISGAWLWWPSNLQQFKTRIVLKRGASLKRTLHDLHNVSGVYLFVILFTLALTGVIICYNGQTDQSIRRGINRLAGVKDEPQPRRGGAERGREGAPVLGRRNGGPEQSSGATGSTLARAGGASTQESTAPEVDGRGGPLPIDVIVEKARAALPHNPLVSIRAPRRPGQPYMATYEFVRITNGGVPFDPYTGERLKTSGEAAFGRPLSPGTTVMGAVFHLHYGWYAGVWSKTLYSLTGLMPLSLFTTGIWMWALKKKGQAKNRVRAKVRTGLPEAGLEGVPDPSHPTQPGGSGRGTPPVALPQPLDG